MDSDGADGFAALRREGLQSFNAVEFVFQHLGDFGFYYLGAGPVEGGRDTDYGGIDAGVFLHGQPTIADQSCQDDQQGTDGGKDSAADEEVGEHAGGGWGE